MKEKAVITGASSGIGQVFAMELARAGYDIVAIARRSEKLEELRKKIEAETGAAVTCESVDLAKQEGINRATAFAADPAVTMLINNAGYGIAGQFLELSQEREQGMIDLNVTTLYTLSKAFGLAFAARKKGGIINLGSTASFQPVPVFSVYGATKAFVLSFTSAISKELEQYGVRIMTLCPGPTATEFFDVATDPKNMAQESKKGNDKPTNSKVKKQKMMTPQQVVKGALAAFKKGKRVWVAGAGNRTLSILASRFPREMVLKVIGNMFKE